LAAILFSHPFVRLFLCLLTGPLKIMDALHFNEFWGIGRLWAREELSFESDPLHIPSILAYTYLDSPEVSNATSKLFFFSDVTVAVPRFN